MALQHNGIYRVVCAQTNTVLDLSGTNGQTVTGWAANGGRNQEWKLTRADNGRTGWTLENEQWDRSLTIPLGTAPGANVHLAVIDDDDRADSWDILPEGSSGNSYRIHSVRNAQLVVDLAGGGSSNATPVILWEAKTIGVENQVWKFELVRVDD